MASNQGQPENEPAVETADETAPEGQALASEHQPTTTAQKPTVDRPKVAGVNDYEQEKENALLGIATEPEPGEPAEETDEPEPPAEPTDEEPLPDAAEPTEPEPDAEPVVPKDFRPRLNNLDDRAKEAIQLVRTLADKGEKITLSEAESRINAKYGVTEEPAKPAEDLPPARTSADVQTEIADVKAQRKEAIRALDPEKQIELEDRLDALEAERSTLAQSESQRQAEQQNAEDAAFDAAVAKDRAYAESIYQEMASPNHAIHAEAGRIWATMQKTNNPLIHSENGVSKVYTMAANKLGIAPSDPDAAPAAPAAPVRKSSPSATPKPQAVSQQAVRRPTAVIPASGADRTTQPGPTADPIAKIRTTDDYDSLVHGL